MTPIQTIGGVEHKVCTRCGHLKPLVEGFSRKGNTRESRCRACKKTYNDAHREKFGAIRRAQYEANPEEKRKRHRAWYHKQDKSLIALKARMHRARNPSVRLGHSLRARLRDWLTTTNTPKTNSALTLLGCTTSQLKTYIESLWQSGMSWDNYGRWQVGGSMTWHIDHIKPCAAFDLTNPEEQRACFHWTNLQPMWARENLSKSDKIL